MGYLKIRPDVQTINRHQRTVRLTLVSTVLQAQPSVLPLHCPWHADLCPRCTWAANGNGKTWTNAAPPVTKSCPTPIGLKSLVPIQTLCLYPQKLSLCLINLGKFTHFLVPRGSTPFMILMIQHSLYKDIKIWYIPEHGSGLNMKEMPLHDDVARNFPLPGLVWIMMGNSSEFKTDSPC